MNDNKLLTCMVAYQMLRKEMTKAQKKTIGKWIKSIGDAQQEKWSDKKRGNHAGKRLKLIYFAAYLDNDQDRIEWVQPEDSDKSGIQRYSGTVKHMIFRGETRYALSFQHCQGFSSSRSYRAFSRKRPLQSRSG